MANKCAFLNPGFESLCSFSNTSEFSSAPDQEANNEQEIEADVVTPWNVRSKNAGGVDYNKFMVNFELKAGLDKILDRFEKKKPFFLYTGRGPSSGSLHLGHLVPFMFVKYLQESFNVPLIVQMTDDEKFMWNADLRLEEARKMAKDNVKDIISVGFDPKNTFIFTNSEYMCPAFYANVLKIWKSISLARNQAIFGFSRNDSLQFSRNIEFRANIPCLIPCAIDQDPYFRLAGDIAPHLGYEEPATMYSKFLQLSKAFKPKCLQASLIRAFSLMIALIKSKPR
uniref:tryptophan--tRNA ligase n=1 Tax=Ditylenchus dipsaci TaxID=166011 RepID=A0A915EC79_9BILA